MNEESPRRAIAADLGLPDDHTAAGQWHPLAVSANLDELTGSERAAATHSEPRLLVRGAAGTGKTRTLEARFRWLVDGGVAPERIALLVPTANRARALVARLETSLTAGFETLHVLTPAGLAALELRRSAVAPVWQVAPLSAGDRLAMLAERVDELSIRHHDFGGRPTLLLGSFVRRIDRLKAELVDAEQYFGWAQRRERDGDPDAALELEFAQIYASHERMLAQAGARDEGDLVIDALSLTRARGGAAVSHTGFDQLLIDDAQELDLAAASLARELCVPSVTVAGDPGAALLRYRGAGAQRLESFATPETPVIALGASVRCPQRVWRAARTLRAEVPDGRPEPVRAGVVELWRCANERSQAQSVAVDIERLIAREATPPGEIAVIVSEINHEGQALAAALEERAISYRLVGEAAFFQRAEIRDVLAWLRLLADPTDAAAVVRALARPPVELRSVDIARCTQIARRRKLDMVSAMAAALESPQVPPEARDRIHLFLKLYRGSLSALDSSRPDLYVHRLIERLGLRRQQLFAAQPDVVTRLQALARFGELAGAYVTRLPQATAREFATSIAAVADYGLREQEEPELDPAHPRGVQVLTRAAAGGLEAEHVYVIGLHAGIRVSAPEPIPEALLAEPLPAADDAQRAAMLGAELYVAASRARGRLVLAYPRADDRGSELAPMPSLERARQVLHAAWIDKQEELFGPAEALASTYRLLRDELMVGTARAGGRLAELRFDTDLDVSHAVVRYLELLKLAALMERPDGQSVTESLLDVNSRILQAVTAEQREIFQTSSLDEYLLDSERDVRARAAALAARDEPTLEPFLPLRGEGVMLSATDIDTYRTCPLKYKFARVFRIPQEPTLNQRFGILVHQVLERYHSNADNQPARGLPDLLGLLDAGWRRGGFGDSQPERQLRDKATTALMRYHERAASQPATPVWFERQFQFKLGRHMLRGRVDRVDRLPDGEYELIDYKTGRPKDASQLANDVQLSLYAVGAREAWRLDASRQAYYYLLDDQKVALSDDSGRDEWIRDVATEVAEGIRSQGFEPTPSYAACAICDYRLVCPAAER
ncbi:MAG: ATP-dependent DNA helicase [Solirubrobacteraceae bacterium]